jgi:hypothetical protein
MENFIQVVNYEVISIRYNPQYLVICNASGNVDFYKITILKFFFL